MIQHEKQENGQVIVYEREITGDELHVVMKHLFKTKPDVITALIKIFFIY